jgi:predicted CoA-binding protein
MSGASPSDIKDFLAGAPHAVVGASHDRAKFGNKVLRAYMRAGRPVVPVNPAGGMIEGLPAYPTLAALPGPVHGVSIVTPPPVTDRIIQEARAAGIRRVWMQPGAESPAAIALARASGMTVIAGGPCVLVELGFDDHE